MKCMRCNRPLKGEAALIGIGPICARSGFRAEIEPAKKIRAYRLSTRPDGSRRYVVFDNEEEFRVTLDEGLRSGKTLGECSCQRIDCEHIAAAIAKEVNN